MRGPNVLPNARGHRWSRCFLAQGLVAILALMPIPDAQATVPTASKSVALVRILDKVTARVDEVAVPVDKPYMFGTLVLTVRACRATLPEEPPEASAFLEVGEMKVGENEALLFQGWMFASSPALSALEHPVYDLWLVGCADSPGKASSNTAKETTTAPPSPASP